MLAQPGVSVNLAERIARTELYMKVGKAYQVEWSLATLSLAPATVRNHLSRCYRKLAVNSKAELAKLVASKRRAR